MIKGNCGRLAAAASAALLCLYGCNAGMAPSGGSSAEVESRFQNEDPQQQIKTIQSSPASPAKKAELIKAVEDKYHVTAGEAPVHPGTR